jgi:precorrin-2 dehydrogenase/sirohydrochlorin ferrochelatase
MLDLSERLVVIVGGGAVAVRKAKGVLEAGARQVRVVAPSMQVDMPGSVERIEGAYEPRHLDGAGLVFAATNSLEVNERVVRDARERNVLVSRADDGDGGDFVTPARFQHGEVVVSVTAGSAALAVAIRNDLARRMDRRHMKLAQVMKELRPIIRDSSLLAEYRAAILRDLASDEAMDVVAGDGGEAALREWVQRRFPKLKL